jgi:hypothetical protein
MKGMYIILKTKMMINMSYHLGGLVVFLCYEDISLNHGIMALFSLLK